MALMLNENDPGDEEPRTEADRVTGTRRNLLRGATLLSAAAIAGPFAAACARTAGQAPLANMPANTQAAPGQSLYDRLGGIFAIAGVVNYFSDEIINDPIAGAQSNNRALRQWHTQQLGRLAGLKFMRTLWVAAAAGGPYQFTPTRPGRTNLGLEEAHRNLRISPREFDAVAAVLSRSLDRFSVPQREKAEVLAAFAAHKNEVTEGFRQARGGGGK